MTSPFSLTAAPDVLHSAPGKAAQVKIFDTGTAPARVTASLMPVGKTSGKCTVTTGPVRDVRLTGRHSWTLQPGQHATAHVRVGPHAPGQDLAVVFSADPAGSGGNVHVTGAVAVQLLTAGPHGARTAGCVSHGPRTTTQHIAAGSVAPGSGTNGADLATGIGAVAVLLLLLAGAVWLTVRRLRHRGTRRQRLAPVPRQRGGDHGEHGDYIS